VASGQSPVASKVKSFTAEDAERAEKIRFELFSVWFDVFAHSAIFAVKSF
jgi:hypothetical protein